MKVAFVAPFYGRDAAGGAESECRQTAVRLAAVGWDVDVLTTCLLDLQHDWNVNVHAAGVEEDDGVCVRRFPADPVDLRPFGVLNQRLLAGDPLSEREENWFAALHINSSALYRYLAAEGSRYDWVCFIPYLFGTSFHGSRLCPGKTVLIPCLHDEGYARMGITRALFERADRIVYHSRSEQELASELFGRLPGKAVLLGEGVDTEPPGDEERFRERYGIRAPFLLYAGRKDFSKNVDRMVSWFLAYRARHKTSLSLVMIGPGHASIPEEGRECVFDLGYIARRDKYDAFAAAWCVCQPSVQESFSLVIMEAWARGTPCLVHADCAVTRGHAVESGGGLYFRDGTEFASELTCLEERPELVAAMGASGKRYVLANFTWDHIMERYCKEVFGR